MANYPKLDWLPDWVAKSLFPAMQGASIWLVGGAIRDKFLNRKTLDFDFVVESQARMAARSFADVLGAHYFDLDADRDTGRVIFQAGDDQRYIFDFALMRGAAIHEDLEQRDFTINSLAVELTSPQELIDPTNGISDLKDGLLRATSEYSFIDDPVRVLRAVRFALLIEGRIDPSTLELLKGSVNDLKTISSERTRDEFFRVLSHTHPIRAIRLMDHLGILTQLLPDLDKLKGVLLPPPGTINLWDQTLSVVDHLGILIQVMAPTHDPEGASQLTLGEYAYRIGRFRSEINTYLDSQLSMGRSFRQLLVFAALYHNCGKPSSMQEFGGEIQFPRHEQVASALVEGTARALRLSRPEIRWLSAVTMNHSRLLQLTMTGNVTKREVYRFLQDSGEAAPGIVLLSLAIALSLDVDQEYWGDLIVAARKVLNQYFPKDGEGIQLETLLRGDEIALELGIPPGPLIGKILAQIKEAQVVGEINTRDDAFDLAKELLNQINQDH